MNILLSVGFLPKNLIGERIVIILRNENIEEGQAPVNFLLHSELYGGGLIVEMIEEKIQLSLAMGPYDTRVIHKSLPNLGKEMG